MTVEKTVVRAKRMIARGGPMVLVKIPMQITREPMVLRRETRLRLYNAITGRPVTELTEKSKRTVTGDKTKRGVAEMFDKVKPMMPLACKVPLDVRNWVSTEAISRRVTASMVLREILQQE